MHLRNAILKEYSKDQVSKIARWIGNDKKRFDLLLHDEYRVVQRAAWIVSMVAKSHSELITRHLPAMVKRIQAQGLPAAVKRNVVRILQQIKIPKKLHGPVMNLCFQFLSDPKETIAVRCFSMTVLANMTKDYPEIKDE